MRVGVVFSQADSGTDPVAIRRFATEVEAAGYEHLMAYDHILGVPASMFPPPSATFPARRTRTSTRSTRSSCSSAISPPSPPRSSS